MIFASWGRRLPPSSPFLFEEASTREARRRILSWWPSILLYGCRRRGLNRSWKPGLINEMRIWQDQWYTFFEINRSYNLSLRTTLTHVSLLLKGKMRKASQVACHRALFLFLHFLVHKINREYPDAVSNFASSASRRPSTIIYEALTECFKFFLSS